MDLGLLMNELAGSCPTALRRLTLPAHSPLDQYGHFLPDVAATASYQFGQAVQNG